MVTGQTSKLPNNTNYFIATNCFFGILKMIAKFFSRKITSIPIVIMMMATPISNAHAESTVQRLDKLADEIHVDRFNSSIKSGNRTAFSALPAKGYKNGFEELLTKLNLYANPRHSFIQCDVDQKYTANGGREPGCIVSLKLARKKPDGTFEDTGIRTEWAIGLGSKKFVPNNSAWADHVTNGDGSLENAFQ